LELDDHHLNERCNCNVMIEYVTIRKVEG